ncbi:MAG: DNA repair protein RadA [Candidatus Omnitrophica bacterium]|nr:DNA repair protein RadA [Candidatus Omnitrophota bacterium]
MFACTNCGYKTLKWLGKCPQCGFWESFIEEDAKPRKAAKTKDVTLVNIKELAQTTEKRLPTGINEFDRVLGGGLVKGEVVLIGGEPGVGKSTLLLETAAKLAQENKVLYVSAEESINQINLRAKRLGICPDNLFIVTEDNIEDILPLFDKDFSVVIIDSIQVVRLNYLSGSAGSLVQVRETTGVLTEKAKKTGVCLIIVGHVTKEGVISGPKVMEHIVDCVVYFEGEKNSNFRILRAMKNRFGSVGEIGVFEMTQKGLEQVENPSSIFISQDNQIMPGRSTACILEGMRPMLVEIQALVTKGNFGMIRRKTSGFDFNRFSLLVAMLEKRLGLHLATQDVFVNITGGIRIDDPTADLALVAAVASSAQDFVVPADSIFIGEVGLSGELRIAYNITQRLMEAKRLGFKQAFIPEINHKKLNPKDFFGLNILGFNNAKEVIEKIKMKT